MGLWVECFSKTHGSSFREIFVVVVFFIFLFHSSTWNVSYLFLLKLFMVFCVMSHYDLFILLNWTCLDSCFLISFQCSCRYLYSIAHCLTSSQEFLCNQWLIVSREGEDIVKKALEEGDSSCTPQVVLTSCIVNNSLYCRIVIKSFVLCFIMAFNLKCTYCVFSGCWALCYGSSS